MKKTLLTLLTLMLLCISFLAACSEKEEKSDRKLENTQLKLPKKAAQTGGSITVALSREPEGIFEPAFSTSMEDDDVQAFTTESMYQITNDLKYVPNLATWDISHDKKTYTFHLHKGVKWHNGTELTMEDWKFALEVLANAAYTGPYFEHVSLIKGAKEYHNGKSNHIEGLRIIDPYTMKITFNDVHTTNLEKLWPVPMPKKVYQSIPINRLFNSDPVRRHPIGLGPFKVANMSQEGEVDLEFFPDYWKGRALLDKVTLKVLDTPSLERDFKKGAVDLASIDSASMNQLERLQNVHVSKIRGSIYSYIGLRFGHRDNQRDKNVDDLEKFKNKKLREALMYALNRSKMIDDFLDGQARVTNSVLPSTSWLALEPKELISYEYNPKKAKKLLDEAGYIDRNGDGFVEDPNGQEFHISFGHYAGSALFESRAKAIIQAWKDIGIRTQLSTGSLIEFNLYNDMKEKDDPTLEAFIGSWYIGADLDPLPLWGSNAAWNYGRYKNEKSDQLLEEGIGEKAFDDAYRKNVYRKWQKLFNEELPILPLWEKTDLFVISNRLQHVEINSLTPFNHVEKWSVTK
ncbi:oligopeptide ABC transporter substrate-binding protein [Priestia koreensis]|uniref:oligopeptide ABC transporter substrate-binding protein n=1 Tax=Priestia koreensis TaxID=284581 RepID=UPI003019B430